MAPQRAVEYLLSIYDSVPTLDELFQLAVIDLVRKEARANAEGPHKAKWIRTIFELLNASSHTVKYEAATSLTTLTQNPAAVKASASAFIELCVKEADNNVKLIVLERINQLRARHEHVLDPLVMDLLRVLASNDMEVRRKALSVALEMVTGRNVEEVVGSLKKQLSNTMEESGYEKVRVTTPSSSTPDRRLMLASPRTEPRIPAAPHPVDPLVCDQILRGRGFGRPRSDGVHRRRRQLVGGRRHLVRA
jgi:vesicle coat complex subunit